VKTRLGKALWLAGCAVLLAVMVFYYRKIVWLHPDATFKWVRHGVTYELLNPRMLGAALLAPWFVAVLAWTLADLPWQQRFLTVLLRIGFAALLGLALARPVRSAESSKIAVVYMVDVSESVSDDAISDAQKIVDEAFAKRKKDDVVKVVTFAIRPRLVEGTPDADGNPTAPHLERHAPAAGAPPGPDG
jgi:Ca-activated chloride channel homolog